MNQDQFGHHDLICLTNLSFVDIYGCEKNLEEYFYIIFSFIHIEPP